MLGLAKMNGWRVGLWFCTECVECLNVNIAQVTSTEISLCTNARSKPKFFTSVITVIFKMWKLNNRLPPYGVNFWLKEPAVFKMLSLMEVQSKDSLEAWVSRLDMRNVTSVLRVPSMCFLSIHWPRQFKDQEFLSKAKTLIFKVTALLSCSSTGWIWSISLEYCLSC